MGGVLVRGGLLVIWSCGHCWWCSRMGIAVGTIVWGMVVVRSCEDFGTVLW